MSTLADFVSDKLKSKPVSIKKRKIARKYLIQALYAWEISQNDLSSIENEFFRIHNPKKFDGEYFSATLHAVPAARGEIINSLTPHLNIQFEKLNVIERCILLLAGYELIHGGIPYRVVINEALDLAKLFGATDSYKFVNGALDSLAKQSQTD